MTGGRDRGADLLGGAMLLLFWLPVALWAFSPEGEFSADAFAHAPLLLGRTLLIAAGAALLAAVCGGALAVTTQAYRVPGGMRWSPLWLAPFLLPAVVVTTGVQSWLAFTPMQF